MDPKFQSSFIPKGPLASSATLPGITPRKKSSLLGFISSLVFTLAVLASLGVFGYQMWLKSRISKMDAELSSAQATLQPDSIRDLTRLDNRLTSVKQLLARHVNISKFFDLLEANTLRTVRFNEFNYSSAEGVVKISMKGQARGYAAVSQQADVFKQSKYINNPEFSDLALDERGNVTFSFTANVDPSLLVVASTRVMPTTTPAISSTTPKTSTSTATSTLKTVPASTSTATTTKNVGTTTKSTTR